MHHRTIEKLASGTSPVHRLDARVKIILVLAFVVAVSLLPPQPQLVFLAPALLVLVALSRARLPWGFVLGRVIMVLPFVLLVAAFLPFTRGQQVLWRAPGGWPVVFREGTLLALAVFVKGALAVLAVGWLVFTTPFMQLLRALRSLRLPRVIVATLSFLFRYLDLLADQSARVRRARLARSPRLSGRAGWRAAGGSVGRLLQRALDRAERVYLAMLSRGYDGEIRVLARMQLRPTDRLVLVVGVTVLTGVVLGGWWLGGRA